MKKILIVVLICLLQTNTKAASVTLFGCTSLDEKEEMEIWKYDKGKLANYIQKYNLWLPLDEETKINKSEDNISWHQHPTAITIDLILSIMTKRVQWIDEPPKVTRYKCKIRKKDKIKVD